MSTFTENTSTGTTNTGSGTSIWKILAIVVAILVVVSLIGPIVKAVFWLGLLALAVVGAYSLFKSKS
ncbi:hypothetical protein L5G32_12865 [Gordonia sp. HY002]|uniref:hypothetical protein n=1 Tax=Gordonia zhenghanii TaxID=2911516 RepID=UPI001EF0B7C4|nr:hypothetical protein [Gordonia zhenghanii]MCF8571161.1 hypothetical protein [Gordonia zhenghanii]MCF8607181.1 hypothetical protein [Gordonia zhenghanii]